MTLRLVGSAARADPLTSEEFAALFDAHASELWRYLARQVGAAQAEDLVAEAFLAAWTSRGDYRPERGSARAWLFGIAVNLLRRHHRTQAQDQRISQRLTGHTAAADGADERVAERVDARNRLAGLSAAIAALPDGDREVLLLNSLAGLSTREIATALGIPEGTVRSRLHRVRHGLRTLAATTLPPSEASR